MFGRFTKFEKVALILFRVAVGALFMQHGGQKLFGWFGGLGGGGATAPILTRFGVAGVLEFFGGLLIVLGLLTRPAALLLAAEMLIAYILAHAPRGAVPLTNRGELALLYLFCFLYIAARGAGVLSLDAVLFRRGDRGSAAGGE